MSKKRGLGRGLEALIPAGVLEKSDGASLREITVRDIKPSRGQARKIFDEEKLEELVASIKNHGIIQPVVVRPAAGGGYELIAGERRWRACQKIGLEKIPAIVRDYKDDEATAVSLIENIQREDLNPLEEAQAYRRLMEEFGLTQEEVSKRVGKSRPFVANMVRLLELPEEIKEMLESGSLTAGHARALLSIGDKKRQLKVAERVIKQGLNVRQVEKIARELEEKEKENKEKNPAQDKKDGGETAKIEDFITQKLGLKAKVKIDSGGKGKLEISFEDREELFRVIALLTGKSEICFT